MKDLEKAEREILNIVKNAKKSIGLISLPNFRVKEEELCKVKDQFVDSLQKHQQRTKELKDLLRRLKDENTHLLVHLGEKDEEIDRLKDEVSSQEEIEGYLRT